MPKQNRPKHKDATAAEGTTSPGRGWKNITSEDAPRMTGHVFHKRFRRRAQPRRSPPRRNHAVKGWKSRRPTDRPNRWTPAICASGPLAVKSVDAHIPPASTWLSGLGRRLAQKEGPRIALRMKRASEQTPLAIGLKTTCRARRNQAAQSPAQRLLGNIRGRRRPNPTGAKRAMSGRT